MMTCIFYLSLQGKHEWFKLPFCTSFKEVGERFKSNNTCHSWTDHHNYLYLWFQIQKLFSPLKSKHNNSVPVFSYRLTI